MRGKKNFRLATKKGEPKLPQSGYIRFMGLRRAELRMKCPNIPAIEHTKIIGKEWSGMSNEEKLPFLEAAKMDKKRFREELAALYQAKSDKKKLGNILDATTPDEVEFAIDENKDVQNNRVESVPIFTDDFIEHNRVVETDLKRLRASNLEYEQQNIQLEQANDGMKLSIHRIEIENAELLEEHKALEAHFEEVQRTLAHALSTVAIPTYPDGANSSNIADYLKDLQAWEESLQKAKLNLNNVL